MLVIPVIDIKNGKSVKVFEGLGEKTIYYAETPIILAQLLRKENAKCIHITDLDGASSGKISNYDSIKEIVDKVVVPVQMGGGIRTFETAKCLFEELGVYRIVLGTTIVENPGLVKKLLDEYGPSKIVISIDVVEGYFVKTGWKEKTNIKGLDLAKEMKAIGVQRIVFQDISRVATLLGPNIEGLKEVAMATGLKVTAAGGIGGYEDLKKVQELEQYGVDSVMIRRAIYENKFPCQAIWREIEKEDTSLDLPKVN